MRLRLPSRDVALRIALAIVVYAFFAITASGYGTDDNAYAIMESCALIGIVAVGLGVTMLAGELDLSVGSVAACAGIVAVQLAESGLLVAVGACTLAGVVYGVVQGRLIAALGISSLVFTLGTFIALRGLAFAISDEKTVTLDLAHLEMSANLKERILIFSPFSLTMIVVFVAVGLLLRYTRIGREVFAIGGGRRESREAGVPQARPMVLVFALSGGLAALAGSLASLRAASAAPAGYETLLLATVTAALIGGVSLYGGRGNVFGIFVGVVTLQFLLSGLALQGAAFWAASLATGTVLLGFLLIDLLNETSPVAQAVQRLRAARRSASQVPDSA